MLSIENNVTFWEQKGYRDPANPEASVLISMNYKVFGSLVLTPTRHSRLSSSGTRAPDRIIFERMYSGRRTLGPAKFVADNGEPMATSGTIEVWVELNCYVTRTQFVMCDSLSLFLLLGTNYMDQHIWSIMPILQDIEMASEATLTILQNTFQLFTARARQASRTGKPADQTQERPAIFTYKPITVPKSNEVGRVVPHQVLLSETNIPVQDVFGIGVEEREDPIVDGGLKRPVPLEAHLLRRWSIKSSSKPSQISATDGLRGC